jgi:hypothetical protein
MKKIITGIALFLFPLFAFAELSIVSEILIGKTQYKIESSQRTEILSQISEENYSSSLNSDSFAFRLGLKFSENFSVELSKHDHGESVNNITVYIPIMAPPSPSGPTYLSPEFDFVYEAIRPIDLESIRVGIKGEMELLTSLFINTRFGLAHWKYKKFSPQSLIIFNPINDSDESGNDIYYSLGAEYKFTENFYLGLEYSLFKIDENSVLNDEVSNSYKHTVKDLSLIIGWEF